MEPREKCKCPKDLQKICKKRLTGKETAYDDIVATMELEDYWKKTAKQKPPKFKVKKFKPLPIKEKRMNMNPPMYMRLRFLHHCDPEPHQRKYERPPRIRYTEDALSDEDVLIKAKRLIKEAEMLRQWHRCRITIPEGPKIIKHADSDVSIIRVPSPRTSGINVSAKRAPVKPGEVKPPLPAKSGYDIYKTHSGIVINEDEDYSPEPMGGGGKIISPEKKKKPPPCAKGGVCTRKSCRKKKCRKYAAMRRRQMARVARTRGGSMPKIRPCRAAMDGRGRKGITDGKPRARHLKSGSIPRDPTGCGLDDIERPDYPVIPADLKKGNFRTHSLTVLPCTKDRRGDVHYGILLGTFNCFSDRFGKSRGRQGLTMSIMAYCLAYHYHPKQWNSKLIDALMVAGDQWYLQLLEKVHDHGAYQGMCEVVPYGKHKVLVLNRKKMQILLCEPEIIGYTMSLDPTVYNLCRGLKAFFFSPDTRACILITRLLKIVIWRDKVCYYVFDAAGRDAKAYSNYANGFAALINVLDLDSVIDILLARSILEDQKFVLAPIKVLAMVPETAEDDLESEHEPTSVEKAKMSYRILSQNLAIVNANLHLGDRMFEQNKYQQALTIAVAALTYAKISPPNTWYTQTLDKILRLGNKLYTDFKDPKITFELGIDNIPNEIVMGPYTCEIIIYRDRTKGQLLTTKECILNIRTGLEDFFSSEHNSGILDFSNYKLAVWRQKDMYYLFDPYPRTKNGERSVKGGQACCLMLLNTNAMAEAFTKNWNFMPATAPFSIHAFKVLKLRQKPPKDQLTVSLSETRRKARPGSRRLREILRAGSGGSAPASRAGSRAVSRAASRASSFGKFSGGIPVPLDEKGKEIDEEYLGEIVSLVGSIQEDFMPSVPPQYKNAEPEIEPERFHNLDSPTVSVTQVVPPWPKPRDKTNEPPEPDPDPEPSPPPTPPPPIPPEGAEEEAEEEEELDEEEMKRRKEEEKRRKLEEEEARRRAEMLPPPMPPPPPTPLLEDEDKKKPGIGRMIGETGYAGGGSYGGGGGLGHGGVAGPGGGGGGGGGGYTSGGAGTPMALQTIGAGGEIDMLDDDALLEPVPVERYVLLTIDAKRRYKLRQKQKHMVTPADEPPEEPPYIGNDGTIVTTHKHNFLDLLDMSQIMRGSKAIHNKDAVEVLPFVSIMAVVLSYKYTVNSWTRAFVDFCVESGKKLYDKKAKNFQACSLHIIPKIAIGHQAYHASIDVVVDGPTWALEDMFLRKFFPKYDSGMLTTPFYSCAFFKKGGLYYLFDGSECNAMGIRIPPPQFDKEKKKHPAGHACFVRFLSLPDLVNRIQYNKNGPTDDAQCILSRVIVRRLLTPPRVQLPEDYEYDRMAPKSVKSKVKVLENQKQMTARLEKDKKKERETLHTGYKDYDGICRIDGTTAMKEDARKEGEVIPEHFACVMAMLMAAMHPLRTWDSFMVDSCIETGNEIASKALNLAVCEKRVIKNIIMDGKFIDLNVKKIIVINENPEKYLEQYMKAVMARIRYVLVRFPGCNLVVVQADGAYHLFDPLPPPQDEAPEQEVKPKKETKTNRSVAQIEADLVKEKLEAEKEDEKRRKLLREEKKKIKREIPKVAGWTRYKTLEGLINRMKLTYSRRSKVKRDQIDNPEFYTFELTSVRPAPRCAMFNYKLSPLFKPDVNPNMRFMKMQRQRQLVDEKMYWLNIATVPWSRAMPTNDRGVPRNTPASRWKAWDIEFAGDLYSLWGSVHPTDKRFEPELRGHQYLACCIICCIMVESCALPTWTPRFLDSIVISGDRFHDKVHKKLGSKKNHVVVPEDYQGVQGEIYPFKFTVKFERVVFGFVYNMLQDRFNLSKALEYFFEKHTLGLLVSPRKNFAFGKVQTSYFMFDCQSQGSPLFNQGAYILKCESLNRLVYCLTIALKLRVHNQQFTLYSVVVTLTEFPPVVPPTAIPAKGSASSVKSSQSIASTKSAKSATSASTATSKGSKASSAKGSKGSKKRSFK